VGTHTSVERCPLKRPNHIDAYKDLSSVALFHGYVGKMYVNMRQQMLLMEPMDILTDYMVKLYVLSLAKIYCIITPILFCYWRPHCTTVAKF